MPYNPATSEYTGARGDAAGNIALLQSLLIQNYGKDAYIVINKEIKGGYHDVKYKSHLTRTDIYDGIFSTRRKKGMLCYVELEDDDSPCDKIFKLKTMPGNLLSHWEELGSGANVAINNVSTVATLAARDALTPAEGDFVNVADARTAQEITDNEDVYSLSYVYDGTQWINVYPYGQDPDRHAKNNDTQLVKTDGNPLTADDIAAHMDDTAYHKLYNDANNDGAENESWTSLKMRQELDKKLDKVTDGDGSKFLADDGTWKAVSTGNGGAGLVLGDVLSGGTAAKYANE